MKASIKIFVGTFFGLIVLITTVEAQIRPVSVLQPMPDFTLPVHQGGEWTLSQLKGKNILLIFPRGLAGKGHWCHICHYQYAELAELEISQNFREKHNLEILFVLPYSEEMVQEWVDKFPDQMTDIENWKNPAEPEKLDEGGRRRQEMMKRYFPKSYTFERGKVPLPFPILIDADAAVSKGLGIFTTEWGGSKIEQNVPTIFLIDEDGLVQFKYTSQNTFDRPGPDYLQKILTCLFD